MYPQGYNNYYNEGFNNVLTVHGKGSVTAKPDKAEVVIGVITEEKQLQTAQEENAKITQQVIESIKGAGVESKDIKTQSYNISAKYDYVEGKQVFRGFEVSNYLKVSIVNVRNAGSIIDTAVKNGANYVSNLNFVISDPSMYYTEALRKAVDDAKSKALIIGNEINAKSEIIPVKVSEQEPAGVQPLANIYLKAAAVTTPIEPGETTVNAAVEIVFLCLV